MIEKRYVKCLLGHKEERTVEWLKADVWIGYPAYKESYSGKKIWNYWQVLAIGMTSYTLDQLEERNLV